MKIGQCGGGLGARGGGRRRVAPVGAVGHASLGCFLEKIVKKIGV